MRVDELLAHFAGPAADRMARTYSAACAASSTSPPGSSIGRRSSSSTSRPRAWIPRHRAELWTKIGCLTREDGLTILLTTHYLDEADRLASQLAIVDRGRVVATGSPEELKAELRGDAIVVELSDGGADSQAVDAIARPRHR